jgi:hypothetical protein
VASAWIAALKSHDASGTLYINTLGVKMDPVSGDGLSATDLATHINTWIGSSYRACLPARCTMDEIQVIKMPFGTGVEGVHAIGVAGGITENTSLPRELAIIFAWKTDNATRSGRGHIAFPMPMVSTLMSGQTFDLTTTYFTTNVPAFFAALDAGHDWTSGGVTEGHLSHVVYSRKNNAYYDVKTRLVRSQPRWVERRQTAP